MRALPAGDAAVLLELTPPSGAAAATGAAPTPAATAAAIAAAGLEGVREVIPAARTVLVCAEPGAWPPGELARRLLEVPVPASPPGPAGPVTEIPVVYDGPDLPDVAALTGLPAADVIAAHAGSEYSVGWLGFSPGFGYLTGLDPRLALVPRLATPRLTVPAGSVAIAGGLAAVYPAASPGGWRLLGRSDALLWDPEREPPALLAPGMRVRFRPVGELPAPRPPRVPASGPPAQAGDRFVEVVQPGPLATVQDLGRTGLGHLGVPRSGAADAGALRAANALAGNEPGAAGLEVTLGRAALRVHGACVAAVTGAPAPVLLATPDGQPARPPHDTAFAVPAGSLLRLGAPRTGLRSYLAVDGGFAVPPVLGSRSADLLSGLGPAPLRPGQMLPLGSPHAGSAPSASPLADNPLADNPDDGETWLRAIAGPRADWFTAGALDALAGGSYEVTAASNRTGLRLAGPRLDRAGTAELPSEGVATGSLQVTHDGQPILLLADHPTTGGYPVIAVVVSADVDLAAQLRPGQRVRLSLRRSR